MKCPNCKAEMEREDYEGDSRGAQPFGASAHYLCEECGYEAMWRNRPKDRWEVLNDPGDKHPVHNGPLGFYGPPEKDEKQE